MQLYLFRFLDLSGSFWRELRLEAADDDEALKLADLSASFGAVEVSRDERRVGMAVHARSDRYLVFSPDFPAPGTDLTAPIS